MLILKETCLSIVFGFIKICKNKIFSLTWLLWGLCRSTHCVIKNATIALPPNAVMCARTIARTSITKLWVKPLSPPFCKQFGSLTNYCCNSRRRWPLSILCKTHFSYRCAFANEKEIQIALVSLYSSARQIG